MKLIITEKPSVARDIARVLKVNGKKEGVIEGNGMIITWALGHLIEFTQPDEYGPEYERWEMGHLPIIPETFKTKPIERSKQQYDIVKAQLEHRCCLMRWMDDVLFITDDKLAPETAEAVKRMSGRDF